jgi:hypothetical protein
MGVWAPFADHPLFIAFATAALNSICKGRDDSSAGDLFSFAENSQCSARRRKSPDQSCLGHFVASVSIAPFNSIRMADSETSMVCTSCSPSLAESDGDQRSSFSYL